MDISTVLTAHLGGIVAYLDSFLEPFKDNINGSFELYGGIAIFMNCWQLYKDKEVKGVNIWSTIFFNTWGIWNLYYYPSLGQWASFLGGVVITIGNTMWVSLMVHYLRYPGGKTRNESVVVTPAAEAS